MRKKIRVKRISKDTCLMSLKDTYKTQASTRSLHVSTKSTISFMPHTVYKYAEMNSMLLL